MQKIHIILIIYVFFSWSSEGMFVCLFGEVSGFLIFSWSSEGMFVCGVLLTLIDSMVVWWRGMEWGAL